MALAVGSTQTEHAVKWMSFVCGGMSQGMYLLICVPGFSIRVPPSECQLLGGAWVFASLSRGVGASV